MAAHSRTAARARIDDLSPFAVQVAEFVLALQRGDATGYVGGGPERAGNELRVIEAILADHDRFG
ncbi:hypothetical protein [Streptomyces sp. BE230]|uniref:hypothetical protein n=1 Tax=Streptomyces sp. BE230 TaxID=3002526 RepID=UPI002ED68D98|nr:hypothetical protein [Streptomyces sp. BE230]